MQLWTCRLLAACLVAVSAAPPAASLAAEPRGRYFRSGPFERAQRLMARGDTRGAAQLLKRLLRERPGAANRPQAVYLLGLCLMRQGEYDEAERLFGELVEIYPELREDHLFLRGQSLFKWGNYLDAAAVLKDVDPAGPRGEEARRLRARALFRATDFTELRHWLEGILEKEGRLETELLYLLGHARYRLHDAYGAYRAFKEVWREAPQEPYAGPALAQIAKLKIGERPLISRQEQQAIRALEGPLMKKKRVEEALANLERRLVRQGRGRELRAQIAYARGRIAESRGRLSQALGHYQRALETAPAPATELRARAGLRQARVEERLGQAKRALGTYRMVAARFPDRPESEEALFSSGEILLSRRDYAGAEQSFRALLIKNPVTSYRPRCLWALGWVKLRLGRDREARQFFASLTRMRLPAGLDAAARYWLGKTDASLGVLGGAREQFRELIAKHPLSYYAALAEDQLVEVLPAKVEVNRSKKGASDVLPKDLARAEEFLRLGLKRRALDEIQKFERTNPRGERRLEEVSLRSLAVSYDKLGRNLEARKIREEYAREYPHALSRAELIEAARRAHPIHFEAEIRAAAAEFDITESLLFALVRTESGFKADAVSPMNAYGLAQLIMPTARDVTRRIGAGAVSRRRLLTNPRLNTRLGAAYLRQLLNRYEGSEPLALAAYNAGPTAVDSWTAYRVRQLEGVGAAGKGVGLAPRPDELVEEIPVTETRNYVKAVLARARSYARLYPGNEPAPIVLEDPKPLDVEPGPDFEPNVAPVRLPLGPSLALGHRVSLTAQPLVDTDERRLAELD